MSWSITKKAINSDLSKPLNELIESESKAINSDLSTPINEKLGRVQQDGGFDGAVLVNVEIIDGVATLEATEIAGTVTQTIEPESLYKFENIFFNKVTPANTSITCRILDVDDNQLISSIVDKGSLASIDTTLHKSIKAEWTLTRVATTDDSPELHSAFWTWTGKNNNTLNNNKNYSVSTVINPITNHLWYTGLDIEGEATLNYISFGVTDVNSNNKILELKITVDDEIYYHIRTNSINNTARKFIALGKPEYLYMGSKVAIIRASTSTVATLETALNSISMLPYSVNDTTVSSESIGYKVIDKPVQVSRNLKIEYRVGLPVTGGDPPPTIYTLTNYTVK